MYYHYGESLALLHIFASPSHSFTKHSIAHRCCPITVCLIHEALSISDRYMEKLCNNGV